MKNFFFITFSSGFTPSISRAARQINELLIRVTRALGETVIENDGNWWARGRCKKKSFCLKILFSSRNEFLRVHNCVSPGEIIFHNCPGARGRSGISALKSFSSQGKLISAEGRKMPRKLHGNSHKINQNGKLGLGERREGAGGG